MPFAFIPKAEYHIGQKLTVNGRAVTVRGFSLTGASIVVACNRTGKQFVCVITDAPPIVEIPAQP